MVLPVAVPMNLRHCSPNTGVNFFLRALTFRIVKMSGRMYSKIIAETIGMSMEKYQQIFLA